MSKIPSNKSHRVTIFRDTALRFPELWLSVYLAGENEIENSMFRQMFTRGRCFNAKTPEEADLVVFGGGADVSPSLYETKKHFLTHCNPERDKDDLKLWDICYNKGIPMLGICRGAQFLHVMNGGVLYQDVNNHYGSHSMYDCIDNRTIPSVSSVHHQMVKENKDMTVLAYTLGKSTTRFLSPSESESGPTKDIEAFFYRDTCCLGIQGHPEYSGYYAFMSWALKQVYNVINENPDIEIVKNVSRLKKDILETRTDKTRTQQILTKEIA